MVTSSFDKLEQWKSKLASLTELILPTDYPRPIPYRIVESEYLHNLSEPSSLALMKLILELDGSPSPFGVLLALFSILLSKYTGESDITVGSSSTNNNLFILRMDISEQQSLLDTIRNVLKVEKSARDDEVPFQELLAHLSSDSEDFRPSFFKVRFFNLTDTSPEILLSSTTSGNCDLTIFISQETTLRRILPIQIKIAYNSVLFTGSRIEFLVDQLELLLKQSAANPNEKIAHLSLLTDKSKAILPDPLAELEWDEFKGSITDIFAKNSASHPHRTCVVESIPSSELSREFTYRQINNSANLLANYLLKCGTQREDVVVLYSYRGVDLVVAIMGVLKAGATFSVIDPAYPPSRQIIYLSVAKPSAIIVLEKAGKLDVTVEEYIAQNINLTCRLDGLILKDDSSLHSINVDFETMSTTDNPNVVLGPDSVATLSFTSGSTGIPKGVRGRHFSLTHFYPWMKQEFNLTEAERFTMLSGIAHDPIQRDIFTPLFLGAQLHIPTVEDIGMPGALAKWMYKQSITITHLTPAMGQLLSANATQKIPSLRNSFFVGDVLTKRDVLRLQHLASNTHVINMYGTTETQRAVSYLDIPPLETNPGYLSEKKDVMPAGKGMKNVQLLVVTPSGNRAGVGELGEIYVRSGGLAEGYLALPEVTKEKFLKNPFRNNHNELKSAKGLPFFHGPRDRMYKTGDVGRYCPDGSVECTGRADDQVKIRGFRIELGEIDTHLSQNPSVRENVTLVRRDKNEEMTLVTYFVPMSNVIENMGELIIEIREYLKQKLPSYAIPTVFVPLTRMPLTPNGKIDKNSLPFPDTALAAAKINSSPNNSSDFTKTQLSLRKTWSTLLNIAEEEIGPSSNFFDLGGHSILATRLIFDIRKVLAVDAPLGMVYKSPTLSKMSHEIDIIMGEDLNLTSAATLVDSNEAISNPTKNIQGTVSPISVEEEFDYASDLSNFKFSHRLPEINIDNIFSGNRKPTFFVTGVTGFLGAFILEALFKRHANAVIWCLVRASDEIKGLHRILDNLKRHLIEFDDFKSQLKVCCGDLSAPQFGLIESVWNELCETVDIVIHNGALVHWVYPYAKLRGPNVIGTVTALTLSSTHHLKPLHFVSSTSTLDTDHYVRMLGLGDKVLESDDLEGSRTGLRTGYGQTKWVAEKIVLEAGKAGIPVTITRPGYIVGDSRTGVTNTDDFIWRLVKGCLQLGKVPSISNIINMCSVDYVAKCIAEVATLKKSIELKVFHTWNNLHFRFDDLFAALSSNGYSVQETEYIHWRTALMDFTLSGSDTALFPLLHFVLDDLPTSTKAPELDDSNMRDIISGRNIKSNNMRQMMPLYLGYLCSSKFIEFPAKHNLPILDIWANAADNVVTRSGS